MKDDQPRGWLPENEIGLPDHHYLPDALLSTNYIRRVVREALELSEAERAASWKRRRSFAARKLFTAGLDEDAIVRQLQAFHRRVKAEAEVRRLINRVERAIENDDAEALVDDSGSSDVAGTPASASP